MDIPGIGRRIIRGIVIGFAFGLAACGGSGGGDQDAAGTQPPQLQPPGIGAAGGTVLGPNGSKVEIPAGALAAVTQIAVDQTAVDAPPLPAGLTPIGQMFAFTPHGTTFAAPVTITMPFDPAAVPAGEAPALYKTNAQNQWEKVANATFGASTVSGQVSSFSHGQVVTEDFAETDVNRFWTFSELRNVVPGISGRHSIVEIRRGVDIGGLTVDVHDFGPADFDAGFELLDGSSVVRNGIASGAIASAADGRTLQVAAEAPLGNANIEGETVGSRTQLVQEQTFTKRSADATLSFTVPLMRIEAHDENAVLARECAEDDTVCNPIKGFISFKVEALTQAQPATTFFQVDGSAVLYGLAERWSRQISTAVNSMFSLWKPEDFDFAIEDPNGASDSKAVLTLRNPQTFDIDLSSIEVGEAFHVRITAVTSGSNRIGGPPSERPTSVGAYLNFEAPPTGGGGGGSMLTSSGLEQTDTPAELPEPPPILLPPASCSAGPSPGSGTLQFSQATYSTEEDEDPAEQVVTVTRTGGTNGPITAVLTGTGITATGDSDFKPVTTTVFFADGDSEPRVVEIPIIEDSIDEANETVQLELVQGLGCGVLGAQDSAVLTILDNDAVAGPSGLDASFDGDGKVALEAFGGDRSGMAVQADGKVIMVGGTTTDFIMARFNADGTLDDNFGDSGKVTVPIVGSQASLPQEANAVAVQRDGKIVVAGNARTPNPGSRIAVALVRFDSDGSIDNTFGNGGFVFGPTFLFGRAFAVAIDSEDRIVIAGDAPKSATADFGDFLVARFNPNGTIDTTFGLSGSVITDVGGVSNEAHGLEVLADNSILVSGFAPIVVTNTNGTTTVSEPVTAVVRYQEDGDLEPTFGSNGRVQLDGENVGRALAVQSDGRIVLVGNVDVGILPNTLSRFALMRLQADGTVDDSFGDGGKVQTSFTDRGDAAFDVALQADGKIVVAGGSNIQINSNFAVARYESDGDLDQTFTDDGKLTIDFFGFTDVAENVAIQANGKIVLGGLARNNVDGYAVARVLP